MKTFAALLILAGHAAHADTVVPARTIRAQEMIAPGDLKIRKIDVAGGFSNIEDLAGLEARVALYPGRPVWPSDVGPPAIIERNQIVVLMFSRGGLTIRTEGRALDRAAPGDRLKVMNLDSRATITGRVLADGSVSVTP